MRHTVAAAIALAGIILILLRAARLVAVIVAVVAEARRK
jgi:hypothetical protein